MYVCIHGTFLKTSIKITIQHSMTLAMICVCMCKRVDGAGVRSCVHVYSMDIDLELGQRGSRSQSPVTSERERTQKTRDQI